MSKFILSVNQFRDDRPRTWFKVSEKTYKTSAAAQSAQRKMKLQPLQFIQITEEAPLAIITEESIK